MTRPHYLLHSVVLLIVAVSAAAAQEGTAHHGQTGGNATANRLSFEKEAMSILPPESFRQVPNMAGFLGDPAKFGNGAIFLLSRSVDLNLKGTAGAADEFERMMKTSDYQQTVARQYVDGLGTDRFKSISVVRTDLVTVNRLPTIKVDLSMTLNDQPVSNTMLVFVNFNTDKAYYIAWFAAPNHFDEVTRALKPTIDSIEYK